MRSNKWIFLAITYALLIRSGVGQRAAVNVNAESGAYQDTRPFGKYLAEICRLSGENRLLTCTRAPLPCDPKLPCGTNLPTVFAVSDTLKLDQTISLKLICDPAASKNSCNTPQYPLTVGKDFFVSGKSDSGLPVAQVVASGSAIPVGGLQTVRYRANAPGYIVIRATANGDARFLAAAPADLILEVSSEQKPVAACSLIPSGPSTTTPLDAATLVSLLGNPTPFLLSAEGPNTIAIYSTRVPLHSEERAVLNSFQGSIAALSGRTAGSLGITPVSAKPFTVELTIPHATALGDVAIRINSLNYSQLTVQDVSNFAIRVTAPTTPECDTWKSFLTDIRTMVWRIASEPMMKKLFYLSSSDVAAGFSSLSSPSTSTSASTTAPAASSSTPAAGSSPSISASNSAAASSGTPASGSTASTTTSSNGLATISVSQPPGTNIQISSDTTPCVIAGLAFGNSTACAPTNSSSSSSTSQTGGSGSAGNSSPATPTAPTPLAMGSVAVAAGTGEQTPPDLLVYSDVSPGDDAQIQERNRIIAQLDLPRPEMIINAWVMQNSSASQRVIGAFSNMVKEIVVSYDRQFQAVVLNGWTRVRDLSLVPGYFYEPFRSYVADRFVADTYKDSQPSASTQELSQAFLDRSQARLVDPPNPERRTDLGICERGRYCLGYNELFNPLKPALTDLLLTIIAANDWGGAADAAIAAVEGHPPDELQRYATDVHICDVPDPNTRARCRGIWNALDLTRATPLPEVRSCSDRDLRGVVSTLIEDREHEPRVQLQCFYAAVHLLLSPAPPRTPSGIGLIRAAIADFLFNYKMSQQYPHEFSAYDLSHSADALNNALSPLIDAFNRDLWTYQLFVRADMQYRVDDINSRRDDRCCVKRIFGVDKPSFFNDGLITVRTISGQPTTVSTVSQSYLNAASAPELTTLLNSLTGTNTLSGASGAQAPNQPGTDAFVKAVLGINPAYRFAALTGALNNYQTTFAQIGRSLSLTAFPRSLNTASAAEITVQLNADETAGGPLYTGPGQSDPATNTSRVANHDTSTRVRVDSIKLFEVSSFAAIVQRSRSRFPLLPPFVEIPYIGTFAGVPIGPAKEFHASTAVLSAYVMPTAADIAYGLRFQPDLVVDALNPGNCGFYTGAAGPDVTQACIFRKALSLHDFDKVPIRTFNNAMIRCLATNTGSQPCADLNLDLVPKMF